MYKAIIALLLIFSTTPTFAQILEPVKWSYEYKQISDNEYELIFTANIDENWAVYSQFINDDGPIPTTFTFEESDAVEFIGNVEESDENKVTKYDAVFEMELSKFFNQAVFTQKIKLKKENIVVKGSLTYMTCDDQQ
ncbi:MAG: hypothetical protein HKN90_03395, partial [Flavobacteriaceae bacterium]|nr:hypothetical protein [Flavobacteriaceae bacterium]